MVNTFLVVAGVDYHVSARFLDRRRLPNQRREALQILIAIEEFRVVAKFFGRDIPDDPRFWQDFIRDVMADYNRLPYWLVVDADMEVIGSTPYGIVAAIGRTIRTSRWIYHAAARMWLLWPDSLKEYIDAHIDAFIERGGHNEIKRYGVVGAPRPPWTFSAEFVRVHRAALFQKEIQRNETPWYRTSEFFTSAGQFSDYIWPCSPATPVIPDCMEPYLRYVGLFNVSN